MRFLFLFLAVILVSCSHEVKMELEILAYHIYSQTQIDLQPDSTKSIALLAKSFGTEESDIVAALEYAKSLKTESALHWKFKAAFQEKLEHLERHNGELAREDYVINILAPYLSLLARNRLPEVGLEYPEIQDAVCKLYGKYFQNTQENSLGEFITDVHAYFDKGDSTLETLSTFNASLMRYGYFADLDIGKALNILKVQDKILPETFYKKTNISVISAKRFIPGLLPARSGYYIASSGNVVIIDDMITAEAEEIRTELEQAGFNKFTDERINEYWQFVGLKLDLNRASEIYSRLMRRDFGGKDSSFIKDSHQKNIAIREAKHLADNIDHPELTYNIDLEFTAHITEAIYSEAPYAALLSAISKMQDFAMSNDISALNDLTRTLWEFAIRSMTDASYTVEALRDDLRNLYDSYRTIREFAVFESLDNFEPIANGIGRYSKL